MGVRVPSSAPAKCIYKKRIHMTFTSKPALLLSTLFWLGVTAFGGYFLMNLLGHKGEKGYINFGIDLVGGTYLTLDVKVEEAVKNDLMSAMSALTDRLKNEKKALPGAPTLKEGELKGVLTFATEADASQASKIVVPQPGSPKVIQYGKDLIFEFSSSQISELEKEAVEGNIQILRTRLDAFGAGEVGIVPEGNRKIGIELPNVSDPEKAKARIGTAAILEMKPVYDEAHTKEELIERSGEKFQKEP